MKSSDPISDENIAQFKNMIQLSGCRSVGGIHWDEIYIKKGIYICKRTNELVGFEDLNLPEDIISTYDTLNENTYTNDTDSDASDESNSDEEILNANGQPLANKIVQFFWTSL